MKSCVSLIKAVTLNKDLSRALESVTRSTVLPQKREVELSQELPKIEAPIRGPQKLLPQHPESCIQGRTYGAKRQAINFLFFHIINFKTLYNFLNVMLILSHGRLTTNLNLAWYT